MNLIQLWVNYNMVLMMKMQQNKLKNIVTLNRVKKTAYDQAVAAAKAISINKLDQNSDKAAVDTCITTSNKYERCIEW